MAQLGTSTFSNRPVALTTRKLSLPVGESRPAPRVEGPGGSVVLHGFPLVSNSRPMVSGLKPGHAPTLTPPW
jgi:hypothetical protein